MTTMDRCASCAERKAERQALDDRIAWQRHQNRQLHREVELRIAEIASLRTALETVARVAMPGEALHEVAVTALRRSDSDSGKRSDGT